MDISWLSHIKSISLYMVGGFNHLEKYKSQWEGLSHISWKNVPNHQPEIKLYTAAYNFLRKDLSIAYGNLVPGGKKNARGGLQVTNWFMYIHQSNCRYIHYNPRLTYIQTKRLTSCLVAYVASKKTQLSTIEQCSQTLLIANLYTIQLWESYYIAIENGNRNSGFTH